MLYSWTLFTMYAMRRGLMLNGHVQMKLSWSTLDVSFAVIGELDTGGSGLSSPTFSPSAELESSPQ